jgi:hypothetical protein
MTRAMWDTQVELMNGKMREMGVAPLTPEEQQTILQYLTANAGKE